MEDAFPTPVTVVQPSNVCGYNNATWQYHLLYITALLTRLFARISTKGHARFLASVWV